MNRFLFFPATVLLTLLSSCGQEGKEPPHRVYFMPGLHVSCYHSWRGDAPDETGFGTDIRVMREVLRLLNEAEAEGLEARVYWDFTVHWTVEQVLPEHAPDILEAIRERVDRGLDEVLVGPYNNGITSVETPRELVASLRWALENPFGSGLEQVFGRVTPIFRPQEGFLTTGQIPLLRACGLEGLVLAYSNAPFTAFSNFIPPLEPEDRYGPVWLKTSEDGPRILLLPNISVLDLVNRISLENLMLELRELQTRGAVESDLLVHLNFDADADTWIPLTPGLPNLGGIREYIEAVHKYPWARFTTPSDYLEDHQPRTEIVVRQDLADGAFDGYASWAEKHSSLELWSDLERSRFFSHQADALGGERDPEAVEALWGGKGSCFFDRLLGMSATHFGMATPVIQEQRITAARRVVRRARRKAEAQRERLGGQVRRRALREAGTTGAHPSLRDADVVFEIFDYPRGETDTAPLPAGVPARVPLLLPTGVPDVEVRHADGNPVPCSLVNVEPLDGRWKAAELLLEPGLGDDVRRRRFEVLFVPEGEERSAETTAPAPSRILSNPWIEMRFEEPAGLASFTCFDRPFGDASFLDPFVTYESPRGTPVACRPQGLVFRPLAGEQRRGIERVGLTGVLPIPAPEAFHETEIDYTFTLPADQPFVLVDVRVRYPFTPSGDEVGRFQQSLSRRADLRWRETGPFQIRPAFTATPSRPFRVWKRNYLGVTSSYEVRHGDVNPRNATPDSFNHHVTAGWVAVTNGEQGLLVAEDASRLSGMAFAPLRLREREGRQHVRINPFGTYHGEQFDYSHLGGEWLGKELTLKISSQFLPNAPSFNGKTLRFSLLLAPYEGDAPPTRLQEQAAAFFYPHGVLYLKTPLDEEVLFPDQMEACTDRIRREALCADPSRRLPAPDGLSVTVAPGSALLVWNAPEDPCTEAFEVFYATADASEWQTVRTEPVAVLPVSGLRDGATYRFKVRAVGGASGTSPFSAEARAVIGPDGRDPVKEEWIRAFTTDPLFVFKFLYHVGYYYATTSLR